jgi:hypothetical protein
MPRYLAQCAAAIAVAQCAACSGSAPTVRDSLIGAWGAEVLGDAFVGYGFIEDGFVTSTLMDSVSPIRTQIQVGTFELRDGPYGSADDDGSYLLIEYNVSTCDTRHVARVAGFWASVVGDELHLDDSSRTLTLRRLPEATDDGPGPQVVLGCFTELGFVESDARQL